MQSLREDLDEAEKIMRLNLGAEFNKEIKATIIKRKFPRLDDVDIDRMIATMETQEDSLSKSESGKLFDRIPSLMRMSAINANSGGKQGG